MVHHLMTRGSGGKRLEVVVGRRGVRHGDRVRRARVARHAAPRVPLRDLRERQREKVSY